MTNTIKSFCDNAVKEISDLLMPKALMLTQLDDNTIHSAISSGDCRTIYELYVSVASPNDVSITIKNSDSTILVPAFVIDYTRAMSIITCVASASCYQPCVFEKALIKVIRSLQFSHGMIKLKQNVIGVRNTDADLYININGTLADESNNIILIAVIVDIATGKVVDSKAVRFHDMLDFTLYTNQAHMANDPFEKVVKYFNLVDSRTSTIKKKKEAELEKIKNEIMVLETKYQQLKTEINKLNEVMHGNG